MTREIVENARGSAEGLRGPRWPGAALCTLFFTAGTLVASAAQAPRESAGDESLLAAALVVAEKLSVPPMVAEENLTWKSDQLAQLARLYAKAGRFDQALAMVRQLDAPDRTKAPALAQIAVAALQGGERQRADLLIQQLSAMEEWTAPIALASIARALHAAGDRETALRLAGQVEDPLERGRLALEIGGPQGFRGALDAAAQISPTSQHVLRGNGAVWEETFDDRQAFLLQVLSAAVDRGELDLARQALQALDQGGDRSLFVWRTRALLEIARGERAAGKPDAGTLQRALAEVEAAQPETMGDLRDKVDLLATLAGRFGGDQAVQVLTRAGEVTRQVESVPEPSIRDPFHCEMLSRLAAAWTDLGHPQKARELLARAAQIAGAMKIPPSSWRSVLDQASAARKDRVEAQARAAAGFEHAGDTEKGKAILASVLTDIGRIKANDWRQSAWKAVVEAYDAVGHLDRALEILGASPAPADTFEAVQECAERLPASEIIRLEPLVRRLPASYLQIDLSARIAAQLAAAGRQAEADWLTAAALSALATHFEGWDRALILLANDVPDSARPAGAEQRKALQAILRNLRPPQRS